MPTRRDFFSRISDGLMGTALASLLAEDMSAAATAGPTLYDLTPKQPHHEPKAKSVIQLFMNGGPFQADFFDPKPAINQFAGQRPKEVEFRTENKTGCHVRAYE